MPPITNIRLLLVQLAGYYSLLVAIATDQRTENEILSLKSFSQCRLEIRILFHPSRGYKIGVSRLC